MNQRSCHMEDDECPNPCEEQYQREGKKYEPHEHSPLTFNGITLRQKPVGESTILRAPEPQNHIPLIESSRPALAIYAGGLFFVAEVQAVMRMLCGACNFDRDHRAFSLLREKRIGELQ